MQSCRHITSTGQDELLQRRNVGAGFVDPALQLRDVLRAKRAVRFFAFRRGQLRPERKQFRLDLSQRSREWLVVADGDRRADRCVGLVHLPIGGHARIILADSASSDQAGRAVIAAFGVEFHWS